MLCCVVLCCVVLCCVVKNYCIALYFMGSILLLCHGGVYYCVVGYITVSWEEYITIMGPDEEYIIVMGEYIAVSWGVY